MKTIRSKWKNFLRRIGYSKEEKSPAYLETPTTQTAQPQKTTIEPLDFPMPPVETIEPQAQIISSEKEPQSKLYKTCKFAFSYAHKLPPFVKLKIIGEDLYAFKDVDGYILKTDEGNFYEFPPLKVGVQLYTEYDEYDKKDIFRISSPLVLGEYEGPRSDRGDSVENSFTDFGCISGFSDLADEMEQSKNPLERLDEALIIIEGFLTVIEPEKVQESYCSGLKQLTEKKAKQSGKLISNINILHE